MDKKTIALLMSAALLAGMFAGTVYSVYDSIDHVSANQGLKEHSAVSIQKNDEPTIWTTNLITNKGKVMLQQATNGTKYVMLDNLSVGYNTSALAATDVELANAYVTNGLSAAIATLTGASGVGNQSLNYQWTVTTAASEVNTTGIYNTTGTGTLFAEAWWTPTTTLQIGDKLNVTYYWWVS